MKIKSIFILFIIVFILFIGFIAFQFIKINNNGGTTGTNVSKPYITIENTTFKLELAKTIPEQNKGLSNRKSLAANRGMLFLFPEKGFYSFWMKDMEFPLDIIFISGDTVVTIVENAPAPKSMTDNLPLYNPEVPVDKVLEVNAGTVKKYGIVKGDKVTIAL